MPTRDLARDVAVRWPTKLGCRFVHRFDPQAVDKLTGLRGMSCLVTWQTVFLDIRAPGSTHGSVRTGVIPDDRSTWSIDNLRIPEPSPTRSWGTIFEVYCPDGVLLAIRHPEYG
ncbi:MAG TPA: hypothetical protein VFE14_13935 [Micromonosporaceae bacterium]|nr:hypothetical protein [Micromonosporaceae bacterium]